MQVSTTAVPYFKWASFSSNICGKGGGQDLLAVVLCRVLVPADLGHPSPDSNCRQATIAYSGKICTYYQCFIEITFYTGLPEGCLISKNMQNYCSKIMCACI
jgi:hypothetical protein